MLLLVASGKWDYELFLFLLFVHLYFPQLKKNIFVMGKNILKEWFRILKEWFRMRLDLYLEKPHWWKMKVMFKLRHFSVSRRVHITLVQPKHLLLWMVENNPMAYFFEMMASNLILTSLTKKLPLYFYFSNNTHMLTF